MSTWKGPRLTNNSSARFIHMQRVLMGIVVLTIAGYFVYTQWIEPVPYYAVKYDPEMQYLLNSLALFKGVPYAYIDHPGTPVEVIGTLFLAGTRPITRGLGELFIPFHLQRPELILTILHAFITIFSIASVVLLMTRSWPVRDWPSLLGGIGLGITYFAVMDPLSFQTLDWWTHNAFNLAFGTLLALAALLRTRIPRPLSGLEVLKFAILAGLLVAVQLYFIAWAFAVAAVLVLFTVFLERQWRRFLQVALQAGSGIAIGFAIGFAPVMHEFRRFFIWVENLIFHQGRYGQGEQGVISAGRLVDNLQWLWNRGEVIFILSGAAIVLLAVAMIQRRKEISKTPGWWAGSLGLLLSFLLLWALIAKHPGGNYLTSIAAMLPLLLMLGLDGYGEGKGRSRISSLTGGVLVVLFFASLFTAVQDHRGWVEQIKNGEAAIEGRIEEFLDETGKTRRELTILWGYGVPSRCFALRFANAYVGQGLLRDEIDEICPNEYMYDVWGGYVELPSAYEPIAENRDWDIVVLPERFIPEGSDAYAEVVLTGAETRGYGRISMLFLNKK